MDSVGNSVGGENPPEYFTEPCPRCGQRIRVSRESFQGHATHSRSGQVSYQAWHVPRCPPQARPDP